MISSSRGGVGGDGSVGRRGVGGTAAVSSLGEELTHCQPLIEHALNHQRKELQIEQINIRVKALEDK